MELIMYHLVEVKTKKQEDEFLLFPAQLYKAEEDEKWTRPLYKDTRDFFRPCKNLLFREGEARRWLLYDVNKHLIGRIAAFYWQLPLPEPEKPVGYFGFFECTEDKRGAAHLFKAAAEWLSSKGIKVMQGPFHLGGPGFFTGSMSRGFFEPVYGMPYNFAFYNDLFLASGFQMVSVVETYRISLADRREWDFVGKKAAGFYHDLRYTIEPFDPKKFEKFIADFTTVFNQVWASFPGMGVMTGQRARHRFRMLRLFLIKKALFIVYFENRPVAFLVAVPNIQQVVRKFKGRYNLVERVYLWFIVKVLKRISALSGLLYAVVPEHRGKGVEAAMLHSLYETVRFDKLKFSALIMNRIGDFEPEMKKVVQQLDGKLYHRFVTYQLDLDTWKSGIPETD